MTRARGYFQDITIPESQGPKTQTSVKGRTLAEVPTQIMQLLVDWRDLVFTIELEKVVHRIEFPSLACRHLKINEFIVLAVAEMPVQPDPGVGIKK
jgi:hypothetical protein